ncbi:HCN4 protein, partial [Polyodon spathula]|nr:HCN4 protein [Polyodon spathula]
MPLNSCFYRRYWIVVMLVVTLINVLIIPLGVSFFSEVIHKDPLWLAYNVISDSVFIVDLVLNFYTGFISDDKADIVLDLNKIRNHYFKSWFLPDLLSVLPVDYCLLIARVSLVSTYSSGYTAVCITRMIKITRLLSLLRLLRFFKLVRYIRTWEEATMKFFYLIAIIVLLCHWNACLQFLVVLMLDFPDKSWVQVDGLVVRILLFTLSC